MSKSIKSLFAVSLLALVAACGANNAGGVEEFVVIDPVPVSIEPTYSGSSNTSAGQAFSPVPLRDIPATLQAGGCA